MRRQEIAECEIGTEQNGLARLLRYQHGCVCGKGAGEGEERNKQMRKREKRQFAMEIIDCCVDIDFSDIAQRRSDQRSVMNFSGSYNTNEREMNIRAFDPYHIP